MFHRISKILNNNLFSYNTILRYTNPTRKINKYSAHLNINESTIDKYISNIQNEYKILSNKSTMDSKTETRLKELIPVIQIIGEKNRLTEQCNSLNELLNEDNEEMKKLVVEEQSIYKNKISVINQELLESLIPVDTRDSSDSIVLEINAGVGGQEAMLFAQELFDMYLNFAEYKGWSSEVVELDTTDLGGIRHANVFISGKDVFLYFKYEAGVHRVQRIPATERAGRVHTSTVSVVALPQPSDIDIKIQDKDLRIETKRASGAGGQHVNTTDSAVRIVHLPTNISVECQVNRSQIKNREIAMQKLRALLYEQKYNAQIAESELMRKSQVRSNDRNEKIRTYNFSQDRITDHRLKSSNIHNLKGFMIGDHQLETLIEKLHSTTLEKKLLEILNSNTN